MRASYPYIFFSVGYHLPPYPSPQAQPLNTAVAKENEKSKPFRILTSGKLVSIKSTKTIKNVMVWTSGGNRIIEDKNRNCLQLPFPDYGE